MRVAAAVVAAFVFFPAPASAQLRPLVPVAWRAFAERAEFVAEAGGSRLFDQRASLAGTSGDLWEAGNFLIGWRTGRVLLEAGGTVQRFFRENSTFRTPFTDVVSTSDGHRNDSGDYRLSTAVRLTRESSSFTGLVRFGTRLPTTDNRSGLDRDAVDFFATLGGFAASDHAIFSGEAGLGIHSTRNSRFEQDDVFLYAFTVELSGLPVTPSAGVNGQRHGPSHAALRGVENLGEMRFGIRAGSRRWVRVEFVSGYEPYSPSAGVIATAGIMR